METIKIYESALKKIREASKEENREELMKEYEHIKEVISTEDLLLETIRWWVKIIYSIIFEAKETELLTEEIEERYLGLVNILREKYSEQSKKDKENVGNLPSFEDIFGKNENLSEDLKSEDKNTSENDELCTDFNYVIVSEEEEKKEIEAINEKQNKEISELIKEIKEKSIQGFEEKIFNTFTMPYLNQEIIGELNEILNTKYESANIELNEKFEYNITMQPVYHKALEILVNHVFNLDEKEKLNKFNAIKYNVQDTYFIINRIEWDEKLIVDDALYSIREKSYNINGLIVSKENSILDDDWQKELKEDIYKFANEIKIKEYIDEFENKTNQYIDEFTNEFDIHAKELNESLNQLNEKIEQEVKKLKENNKNRKNEIIRDCLQKLELIENE